LNGDGSVSHSISSRVFQRRQFMLAELPFARQVGLVFRRFAESVVRQGLGTSSGAAFEKL
jgi:hypothetical protein